MKQIPIHIISGFLGSGKTTLLIHLLNNFNSTKKIAIVQNEFAPGNIDGKTLKKEVSRHFELLEFNNGSVFCVCLLSDFLTGLNSFAQQHNPDLIFIETSGMSDPVSVGEIFNAKTNELFFLSSVTSIVDAQHFLKIHHKLPQIKNQLLIADNIIINKTDITPNNQAITSYLKKINPTAKIIETSFCQIPVQLYNTELYSNSTGNKYLPVSLINNGSFKINSAVLKTTTPLPDTQISSLLKKLASLTYRVKGFIASTDGNVYSVQCVMDQINISKIDAETRQTEIIAIGNAIQESVLKQLYLSFAKPKTFD
ncbi:MAG: GTP-binding protein [Marinilabiliaceae bacterium]|nr:GTP-binding protein [Marinilabiliaceae bacterium]